MTQTMQTDVASTRHNNAVVYEMPLNDAVRICLRLENLFHEFKKTVNSTSSLNTKNAMNALLKILEVTDRPDIKSKLSQTLTQYATAFMQAGRSPQVDPVRLKSTLYKITTLNHYLQTHTARIGEPLRQNDFLSQIRSNLANPGGVCDYRLPAYTLWQKKSAQEKEKDLNTWMETFRPLSEIIECILQVTRESTPLKPLVAENGFYLQQLNPSTPCHLIRISLPIDTGVFPEIGVGKHRITLRFLTPSYFGSGKSSQAQNAIAFELACCTI